jgi:TonB family protein
MNYKSTASRSLIVFTLLFLLLSVLRQSESQVPEDMRISYFVAPEYPRVASQLLQSGDVVLTVTVDTSGMPRDIAVQSPHILLGESAKECVSRWRFVPPSSPRKNPIFFHYGFSGNPRECNPSTIVTLDLQAPRVTVTVDPLPPFGPDAWPESNGGKRQE